MDLPAAASPGDAADPLAPDSSTAGISGPLPPSPARPGDSLTPVRALNQVSYCPRLYYLQYVECLMPVNEHVEDGLFQHRRVNDPALENRTLTTKRAGKKSKHEEPAVLETTRSVTLSSERLGIVGKLDVVETQRPGHKKPEEDEESGAMPTALRGHAGDSKRGGRATAQAAGELFDQVPPKAKPPKSREKPKAPGLFDYLDNEDAGSSDPETPAKNEDQNESLHTALDQAGRNPQSPIRNPLEADTYPVEYKRSEGPSHGYWENDAIQVCAQAMLLEEALGQPVPRGYLYYQGSKTRVPVPMDQTLRAKTLAAIQLTRELQMRDTPPEPLPDELRHRCHGCSLAPVCMPEETLYLIRHAAVSRPQSAEGAMPTALRGHEPGNADRPNPQSTFTRVLANSDDGAVAYLQEQGSYVSKRGETLIVKKDGGEINRIPLTSLRQVVIFGNVQLSTQALEVLATNHIPVAFLNMYGRFIAALQPAPTKNVQLRLDQYRVFGDPVRALGLARAVVKAKIANQRTLLMRTLRARAADTTLNATAECGPQSPFPIPQSATNAATLDPPTNVGGTPGTPPNVGGTLAIRNPQSTMPDSAVTEMAELLAKVDAINDPAVLLGTEGQAAHLYFSRFGRMLKTVPGREFDFQKRQRRPPPDPVNALLSFAYAILTKDVFSALATVGFDPYHGFFHAGRHGRPSLALDLMEEFRPIIADSVVLTLINNGLVGKGDFITWRDACQLTDEGRKTFFQTYEQRKAVEVTHPVFGYKMSYSRMLEVQARLLAAYVRGDIPHYTGFTVR